MIRKQKFDNGLTLLTESMPHVRSVSLGIWLRQGSRHEPRDLNGISHFLEHLVFKGTERRSARDIALAADSVGMQLDAFTTKEYTCFYAKMIDEHLDDAIDLLADIVRCPRFDAEELERERQVVLEEIRMVEDTPDELIYDLFAEHFYPRHPLGRPIQGTERTVSSMSRRRVKSFFDRSYRPENMLVVAAGRVDQRALSRKIRRAFGSMERAPKPRKALTRPRPRAGVASRNKRKLEQLHVLLGLPAYPENFAGRYTLHVLNAALGGTMSSRLFQRVREERGLAYSVYSGVSSFQDCGFMMIYAATSPRRGRELIDVTLNELRDLRDAGPTADEIGVAKEHLKGNLMLALESTSSRMSNLARQEIYYGRQYGLSQILRGIERVKPAAVHRLCRDIFRRERLALAAIGDLKAAGVDGRALEL